MTKSDIELKLKFIEAEIEIIEESIKWSKRTNISLLLMGTVTVAFVMISCSQKEVLHALDVFSISLSVSALYKFITDMIIEKNRDRHKLSKLDIDKRYYKSLLRLYEEKENDENR